MATAGPSPLMPSLPDSGHRIGLARKTYFDRDLAIFSYDPASLGVDTSEGRLYVVEIQGRVALTLDQSSRPAGTSGETFLSILLEKLMPGR